MVLAVLESMIPSDLLADMSLETFARLVVGAEHFRAMTEIEEQIETARTLCAPTERCCDDR